MNRRSLIIGLVAVAVLLVAMCAYYRARRLAMVPTWLNPEQPPQGVASQLGVISPAQAAVVYGCSPLAGPCSNYSAGSRVLRTYAPSLADDDDALVFRLKIEGGC